MLIDAIRIKQDTHWIYVDSVKEPECLIPVVKSVVDKPY